MRRLMVWVPFVIALVSLVVVAPVSTELLATMGADDELPLSLFFGSMGHATLAVRSQIADRPPSPPAAPWVSVYE